MHAEVREVAIVQHSPAVLDVDLGLERARDHVQRAAADGAELVVFSEAWLGGYPAWMFAMAEWGDAEAQQWYARFLAQSVAVGSPRFAELCRMAADAETTVVMGFNERRSEQGGSVYNSLVTLGPDGQVLNLHRKLTPTHTERIGWAAGDARGLRVVDTPVGRVGGLICWEHWHPLARYALHAQDEQIHVAAWPDMSEPHLIASRNFAFEGRCVVLAAAQYLERTDVPEPLRDAYDRGAGQVNDGPDLAFDGGSAIIGPEGEFIVEPVREPGLIRATVDLTARDRVSHDLDVAGHYGRRDIFTLEVNTEARPAIHFVDGSGGAPDGMHSYPARSVQ